MTPEEKRERQRERNRRYKAAHPEAVQASAERYNAKVRAETAHPCPRCGRTAYLFSRRTRFRGLCQRCATGLADLADGWWTFPLTPEDLVTPVEQREELVWLQDRCLPDLRERYHDQGVLGGQHFTSRGGADSSKLWNTSE